MFVQGDLGLTYIVVEVKGNTRIVFSGRLWGGGKLYSLCPLFTVPSVGATNFIECVCTLEQSLYERRRTRNLSSGPFTHANLEVGVLEVGLAGDRSHRP